MSDPCAEAGKCVCGYCNTGHMTLVSREEIDAEIAEAVKAEREACALLLEHDAESNHDDGTMAHRALLRMAEAIRERPMP